MDTVTCNCTNIDTYTDIHLILVAVRVLAPSHLAGILSNLFFQTSNQRFDIPIGKSPIRIPFQYTHLFQQSSLLWSDAVGARQLRAKALRRRAPRALLREMTYEDKASYDSTPTYGPNTLQFSHCSVTVLHTRHTAPRNICPNVRNRIYVHVGGPAAAGHTKNRSTYSPSHTHTHTLLSLSIVLTLYRSLPL